MSKTLRLLIPQWQGGNREQYFFGAKLLNWLAPESEDETVEVPVDKEPTNNETRDGIVAKDTLLKQYKKTFEILNEKNPDKIVVFGGDCSVELAPFGYLLEKYKNEKTAILWIDAHPDVTTTADNWKNFHAMVLASLLGEADKDIDNLVTTKVKPENVIFAGIDDSREFDRVVYKKYNFKNFTTEEFQKNGDKIVKELKNRKIKNVIVHFDLDVLNLYEFNSQYFAEPEIFDKYKDEFPVGAKISTVSKLINDVNDNFNLIGLGITEHLPWAAIKLAKLLRELPLIK